MVRPATMKFCPSCQKTYGSDYERCPIDQIQLQVVQEFQPGMIIRGKYQILDKIGSGGMGSVYRARHLAFNEICAIKTMNQWTAKDESFVRRFEAEAFVTRKLRHVNAVRVEDFDRTEEGCPFLVMELVEGTSLRYVIQKEAPLAYGRAIKIARQLCGALAMAHKLNIVHRDIKPENVILTRDENDQEVAKLLDFGIAKLKGTEGESR